MSLVVHFFGTQCIYLIQHGAHVDNVTRHRAHYVDTWRHPQTDMTYFIVLRTGLSHGPGLID